MVHSGVMIIILKTLCMNNLLTFIIRKKTRFNLNFNHFQHQFFCVMTYKFC